MIQYQSEDYAALFTHIPIGPLFDPVSKRLVVHEFIVRDDFGGSQALQVLHQCRQVFTSSGRALQFVFLNTRATVWCTLPSTYRSRTKFNVLSPLCAAICTTV